MRSVLRAAPRAALDLGWDIFFVVIFFVAMFCFHHQVEAVRQAASKCLVVLGTGVSAVLVVALGGICQRVEGVLNNNKPSLAVRTHLLELLVGGRSGRATGTILLGFLL